MDAHDEVMAHLRHAGADRGKSPGYVFSKGLPRRYLLTHAAGDVLAHLEMAARLDKDPVQIEFAARPPLVRADAGDHGSPVSICNDGRGTGGLGNEHRESRCIFESGGNGG